MTYLGTANGWVYVAAVVDLFSRKVVGWAVGDSLATDLVQSALRDAIEKRRPDGSQLLHHFERSELRSTIVAVSTPANPINAH